MKRSRERMLILLVGALSLVFYACSGASESEDSETSVPACGADGAKGFHEFFGLTYGMEEHELKAQLGDFTGGRFTEDSTEFIYFFNRVERAPLSVWVDVESHRVVTVFVELLGLRDALEADREALLEEFQVDDCDASWVGAREKVIRDRFPIPESDLIDEEGILSLLYSTEKNDCKVVFKFYPQQENRCTSIAVNWIYN